MKKTLKRGFLLAITLLLGGCMSEVRKDPAGKGGGVLPPFFAEETVGLEDFADGTACWECRENVSLRVLPGPAPEERMPVLEVSYRFPENARKIIFDYRCGQSHPVSERLRFLFRGDGSKHRVQVWCRYRGKYLPLALVSPQSTGWQSLEIPAGGPLHRFYPEVTHFRFVIVKREERTQGRFLIGPLSLAGPVVPSSPCAAGNRPPGIFDTWGGIGADDKTMRENVRFARDVGIGLHIVPVGFPAGRPEALPREIDGVAKRIRILKDGGIMAGISFYNTPPENFVKERPDLCMVNESGERYDTGGFFLSPWNPEAREIWRKHIHDSLRMLEERSVLDDVEAVMLSPGLESEISYEWSHVWAFDAHAVAAYRRYLRAFYENDIAVLNSDWKTAYGGFEKIMPPRVFYPDREHWVFEEFYRYSMLEWCVYLAQAVQDVFVPRCWVWLPHSQAHYPGRFYSARYPLYYVAHLKGLDLVDYVHIPALDWQTVEDVQYIKDLGVSTIGEVDVVPTAERLAWTFRQSAKYGFDGVYIGVLENCMKNGKPTPVGELCGELIREYRQVGNTREEGR